MAPNVGLEGEVRASPKEVRSGRPAERPVSERNLERTVYPKVSSMGDGETKSTPVVRRGLWDGDETAVRSNRGEGHRSSKVEDVNPLVSGIRSEVGCGEEVHLSSRMTQSANSPLYSNEREGHQSSDLFVSSPCQVSTYYTAATERRDTKDS